MYCNFFRGLLLRRPTRRAMRRALRRESAAGEAQQGTLRLESPVRRELSAGSAPLGKRRRESSTGKAPQGKPEHMVYTKLKGLLGGYFGKYNKQFGKLTSNF